MLLAFSAFILVAVLPQNALAQEEAAAADAAGEETAAEVTYTPMGPDMIKGQPVSGEDDLLGSMNVQPQFSEVGQMATGFHTGMVWVMTLISVFVLALLIWVVVRYNKRVNPTPSKTTHNTLIEVVWTVVPVLILIGIAIPSISLLAKQFETAPEDAITVKAIGVQWHWEYEYPDYGVSLISKMLNQPGQPIVNNGVREVNSEPWDGPGQLEVDNRMVVPVGVPLNLQTTANDVIHSFAVPSLWFKLDSIPGKLNSKQLLIKEPGIYYGQCSELCGVKHGYMPIAVEAVPMEQFEQWVLANGGTLPSDAEAEEATAEEEGEEADAEAENTDAEASEEDAGDEAATE